MEDFFVLEIPTFKPEYKKEEKYGTVNESEKNNLRNVLEKSSHGYCMYCFSRIKVDNKLFGHLEHAIEKGNSNQLIECIPNIGLACFVCNLSFKRERERTRKIPPKMIQQFEKESKCLCDKQKPCTTVCNPLRKLQKYYSDLPEAEIILQPMGIKGKDSGEELALQYNVIRKIFQPAKNKYTYSEDECKFIETHINRFRLNDPEYRSRQLFQFVKNVIDNEGKILAFEYDNLIVKLFQEKLTGKTKEEILKICKTVFLIWYSKM